MTSPEDFRKFRDSCDLRWRPIVQGNSERAPYWERLTPEERREVERATIESVERWQAERKAKRKKKTPKQVSKEPAVQPDAIVHSPAAAPAPELPPIENIVLAMLGELQRDSRLALALVEILRQASERKP
jgi:hypothetical protein